MEDWQGVMFRCINTKKALPKWLSIPFFWSCIILGALIILELFLAILLGTFEQLFDQEKRKDMQVKKRALNEKIEKTRKTKHTFKKAVGKLGMARYVICTGDGKVCYMHWGWQGMLYALGMARYVICTGDG
jgi:hypothetical protein